MKLNLINLPCFRTLFNHLLSLSKLFNSLISKSRAPALTATPPLPKTFKALDGHPSVPFYKKALLFCKMVPNRWGLGSADPNWGLRRAALEKTPALNLSPTQRTGQLGENIACQFLKKNHYTLLTRNWRYLKDEIDIIAKNDEVLVFIEVKTRQENTPISGFYSVNSHKKRSLRRICKYYLRSLRFPPKHFRFDIIEVRLCQNGKNHVNHYKNVLLFSKYFQPI